MHRPLQRQIFTRFLYVIVFLCVLTLLSAAFWFHRTIRQEAQERVRLDLQAVSRLLQTQSEIQGKALSALGRAVHGGSGTAPPAVLADIARENGFDFGGTFNPETRTGTRILTGRAFSGAGCWAAGWRDMGRRGYILLPLAELAEENPPLAERIRQAYGQFSPDARSFRRDSVLASVAWVPVTGADGRIAALFYGGRVLSLNNALVDSIRDVIFLREMYEGKPMGTVTLFQGDVRVATNVLGAGGERALGTPVSPAVYQQVFRAGQLWTDRAYVVDSWYLSAYAPLEDPSGRIIGMAYVGVLEARYLDIRNRILVSFGGIFLLGALAAVLISFLLSRSLVAPVDDLLRGTRLIHSGTLDIQLSPGPGASREIAQLMAAFNEMVQAIRGRDLSLTEANDRLRMINRQLEIINHNYTEMLGFVTHELSNMLGVMMLDVHNLRDNLVDRALPEDKEILASLIDYLEKFREMIRNYLDLSRIEKGKMAVQKARINLYWEVLQLVRKELAGVLERSGMKLDIGEPVQEIELDADPNLMRVVFYNLLGNAIKYGYPGGQIRVFGEKQEREIAIHVWNEGLGIEAEAIPYLFQKFHRIRVEGKSQREGSGLGLFITQEIVARHGGTIRVESKRGEWADFVVRLPLETAPPSEPAEPS